MVKFPKCIFLGQICVPSTVSHITCLLDSSTGVTKQLQLHKRRTKLAFFPTSNRLQVPHHRKWHFCTFKEEMLESFWHLLLPQSWILPAGHFSNIFFTLPPHYPFKPPWFHDSAIIASWPVFPLLTLDSLQLASTLERAFKNTNHCINVPMASYCF